MATIATRGAALRERRFYRGPSPLGMLRYLTHPEAQTFAFSVASMAVLAFFPFMIVLITIIRRELESRAMYDVLLEILRDHLPVGQEYIIRALNTMVNAHKTAEIGSLALLFFAARGVFIPLEVALNRIWHFEKGRNWLRNQINGAALVLGCGVLALISVAFTAVSQYILTEVLGGRRNPSVRLGAFLVMKLVATLASIAIFFLIYWRAPGGKVSPRKVLPAAIIFGLTWELVKYGYILVLPHLNFQAVYGPFAISVALLFWGYVSGLVLLAGGYFSASP